MPQELRIVGGWGIFDFKGFRGLWSDQPTLLLEAVLGPCVTIKTHSCPQCKLSLLKDQVVFHC